MSKDISDRILEDIKNRVSWADRQAIWYVMRHDGIRRRMKPFPGAADLHFPLIDQTIEKLKPFYYNQMFATENVAGFTGKPDAPAEVMTDLAYWFDYKVKQKSNFEDEILLSIDYMLSSGRGPLKISWDAAKKCLRYEAIESIYLIVPQSTGELADTDRCVHVQHLSKREYQNGRMSGNYSQDAGLIKRICGKGVDGEGSELQEKKATREGLTYSDDPDTIILWEVFERMAEGWKVHTFSPLVPNEPVRETFMLPYQHKELPIVAPQMERKERGYYSSRGVSEILAPFETSLCKLWNEKHDAMTFFNRPLLSTEQQIPNPGNLNWQPGMILPFKVDRVDMGKPPMSFDEEMVSTRSLAENRIGMPDFGIGGMETPNSGQKTAAEVAAIQSQMAQVVDLRSRLFRRALASAYRQSFALLKQYDEDFQFVRDGAVKSLPADARNLALSIEPSGTSSSWDSVGRMRKAVARKQMFTGVPHINQVELDKSVLELDEPGLIQRLIIDPNLPQQQQAKLQELEIPALMMGMPVPVAPDEDHAIHALTLAQFMFSMEQRQAEAGPEVLQVFQAHMQAHMQQLEAKDAKAAGQVRRQIAQMQRAVQQQAKNIQPMEAAA